MVDAVYTDLDKAFGKMLHGTLVQKVRAEKIVAENAKKNTGKRNRLYFPAAEAGSKLSLSSDLNFVLFHTYNLIC